PPRSDPVVGPPEPISVRHVVPTEKRFLRGASARNAQSRSNTAAIAPPNSRQCQNFQPPPAARLRLPLLQSHACASQQNSTSASPTPSKENQCRRIAHLKPFGNPTDSDRPGNPLVGNRKGACTNPNNSTETASRPSIPPTLCAAYA